MKTVRHSDFRVESDGNANMLFVDGGANMVGVGNSAPTSTLVTGNANLRSGFELRGGPNGNAQLLEMVDGAGGSFSSVTIDVQFPGAGGWIYEVQIGSTFNTGGFQAGGGYTNGTINFTHTTNAGSGWTVSSPSNDLIRFVSTNIGTHPVVRIKVVSSLGTGGPDMDDVTITFA
jgi:prepilin-type processing-associated H-X9-DG protein